MRIVAIADTHLYTDDFVVPDGDLLVHAGDLCRRGNLGELERAAAWFAGLPHRYKIVVAGNHDWAFLEEPDRARALFRTGCADLRRRVAEVAPRLHLFGHIHQDGGLWRDGATTFANVTTWECERGATVIDLDANSLVPVVVPPRSR